jgi:structural maintenance of chromosome 3 (chondroitin sulfate proteoglycan 6)
MYTQCVVGAVTNSP